jgi:structural maintenance of chromosome 3 (chondroitin sulfate proteoglycan 6)
MAAYVEIIFDNADGRLALDSDEVVLRRTVGHKKDEFFINRKRAQKSEVQSLLESAGFSKSNPYYIVQQGKVANLCVMKDSDRLNLLKEVAGTTVYEERRTESLRIMQENVSKQEHIKEVLDFIDERLDELEKEKEELSEYEQLDKNRRALEYTLYDKELSKASEQLNEMEATREEEREKQQELHARIVAVQDEIQLSEDSLQSVKAALDRLASRRDAKHKELKEAQSRHSEIEVALQEGEADSKARGVESADMKKQLAEIEGQIKACEAELAKIVPKYDAKYQSLQDSQQQLDTVKARVEALYGKQGRNRQFSSKKERDAFLQSQIAALQAQADTKEQLLQRLQKEVEQEAVNLGKERQALSKAEEEKKTRSARYEALTKQIQERTQARNDLQEQRKKSWRDLETFQEEMQEAKLELDRGKQQLNSTLPRHIAQGLVTVEQIVQEKRLTGYYGPLIDNFALKNDGFRTAVEVAAGNALFHVIVDNDQTAAVLMKELERRKAGRLTFLPLNRLRVAAVAYPDSPDVRPLIDIALEYENDFEQAIRQVFGKKLLARDLDVASHFSKEYQLDAITREGDLVNRRGGFEGGFHDDRVSRIGAVYKIRDANVKLTELLSREEALRTASDRADNQVSEAMRELQKLDTEREHIKANSDQATKEISDRTKSLSAAQDALHSRRSGLAMLDKEVAQCKAQAALYAEEKAAPMSDKLSDQERAELVSLQEQSRELQGSLDGLEAEVSAVSTDKRRLEAELKDNLLKRKGELELLLARGSELTIQAAGRRLSGAKAGGSGQDQDADLAALRLEKKHVHSLIETTSTERDELDRQLETKKLESSKFERELETRRSEEQEALEEMNDGAKMQDKLLNKRAMLLDTVQQKQRLIRDLGTLPRKETEAFKHFGEKQLMSELKSVNEDLKKFATVNKKALDQYVSFNEQRSTLVARKDEMDNEKDAIEKLVESLDVQKEEAILRTFRGVSMHFAQVFSELVKDGKGQLVMRTTADGAAAAAAAGDADLGADDDDDDDDDEEEEKEGRKGKGKAKKSKGAAKAKKTKTASLDTFQGVQVRVSFTSSGQQFEMNQLSGGQKALVALAIIFAIQRCDPAPFYLFDEIDQALDANYRAEVARLIQRQAEDKEAPAQFITTTFRPELVAVAHKCYGISLANKASTIHPLAKVRFSLLLFFLFLHFLFFLSLRAPACVLTLSSSLSPSHSPRRRTL